jgi:hypothetical protein
MMPGQLPCRRPTLLPVSLSNSCQTPVTRTVIVNFVPLPFTKPGDTSIGRISAEQYAAVIGDAGERAPKSWNVGRISRRHGPILETETWHPLGVEHVGITEQTSSTITSFALLRRIIEVIADVVEVVR